MAWNKIGILMMFKELQFFYLPFINLRKSFSQFDSTVWSALAKYI